MGFEIEKMAAALGSTTPGFELEKIANTVESGGGVGGGINFIRAYQRFMYDTSGDSGDDDNNTKGLRVKPSGDDSGLEDPSEPEQILYAYLSKTPDGQDPVPLKPDDVFNEDGTVKAFVILEGEYNGDYQTYIVSEYTIGEDQNITYYRIMTYYDATTETNYEFRSYP